MGGNRWGSTRARAAESRADAAGYSEFIQIHGKEIKRRSRVVGVFPTPPRLSAW